MARRKIPIKQPPVRPVGVDVWITVGIAATSALLFAGSAVARVALADHVGVDALEDMGQVFTSAFNLAVGVLVGRVSMRR